MELQPPQLPGKSPLEVPEAAWETGSRWTIKVSSQLRPSVVGIQPCQGLAISWGRKAEPHTDCSLRPLTPALANPL